MTSKKPSYLNIIAKNYLLILAFALLAVSHLRSFDFLWTRWNLTDSYYSHGPIVPVLACIMIWLRRDKLSGIKPYGSWLGLSLVIAGSVLYLSTAMFAWKPLYGPAVFMSFAGLVWTILGFRAALALSVPILFLITMIPMPDYVLDVLTGKFTLVASAISTRVFESVGYSVMRSGNILTSDSFPEPLVVGGACSGLKLLIANVMCTAFLAGSLEGSRGKKLILLAAAFPFSIALNALRIIIIGSIGIATYSADAVSKFHDASGYLTLIIGAFIMLGFARLTGLKTFRDPESCGQLHPWIAPRISVPAVCALAVLVVLAPLGFAIGGAYDSIPKGTLLRSAIPVSFDGWHGTDQEIEEDIKERLAKGDLLSRVFENDSAEYPPVHVLVNVSPDIASFHNPYDCLPGSGVRIAKGIKTVLNIEKPNRVAINATVLRLEQDSDKAVMIYWYNYGNSTFPNAESLRWQDYSTRVGDVGSLLASPGSLKQIQHRIQTREVTWYRFYVPVSDHSSGERFLRDFIQKFLANVDEFGEHLKR